MSLPFYLLTVWDFILPPLYVTASVNCHVTIHTQVKVKHQKRPSSSYFSLCGVGKIYVQHLKASQQSPGLLRTDGVVNVRRLFRIFTSLVAMFLCGKVNRL